MNSTLTRKRSIKALHFENCGNIRPYIRGGSEFEHLLWVEIEIFPEVAIQDAQDEGQRQSGFAWCNFIGRIE
jgi:hypothetical protein